MKKSKLWTRNFTTVMVSTTLGCIGGVAGNFALSFLVYEQTKSTLASALIIAIQVIPGFIVPLFVSPIMDRLPRKPFLVCTDVVASAVYLFAGLWLKNNQFEYVYYLLFSLILTTIGSFDELSFNALYPKLIPDGMEEQGYAISSMLYPMVSAIMMPISAILYKKIGVANILLCQGLLSLLATLTESTIKVKEEIRQGTKFSLKQWWGDIKEATSYLKKEKGILAMTVYSGTSNGFTSGYESILVAFFSTTAGFTVAMYSFFTVVEMIGRTIGGSWLYKKPKPKEKKYGYALFVYLFYDTMDGLLLWLPYPLMLVNRTICGFLGVQSGTMRYAATQKYIPESMRARVNAFQSMAFLAFNACLSLVVGAMGEIMDLRLVLTLCSVITLIVCALTIVRRKKEVTKIYMQEGRNNN